MAAKLTVGEEPTDFKIEIDGQEIDPSNFVGVAIDLAPRRRDIALILNPWSRGSQISIESPTVQFVADGATIRDVIDLLDGLDPEALQQAALDASIDYGSNAGGGIAAGVITQIKTMIMGLV